MLRNNVKVRVGTSAAGSTSTSEIFTPSGHEVTFELFPSYPDGIHSVEDLKAYLEDSMASLANAGWKINIYID